MTEFDLALLIYGIDLVAIVLILAGCALSLIAAIGIVRLPDLYTRMHASAKTGTLALLLIMFGLGVVSADWGTAIRALLVSIFFLITAPVASHLIGRAAHRTGVPLCESTIRDDLARDEERRYGGQAPPGMAPEPREG